MTCIGGTLRDCQRAPLDSPAALALTAALDAESQSRYPFDLSKHFKVDPAEFEPGRGIFVLAYQQDEAVGCGAIRMLGDDAEIKRMYVVPAARGHGRGARRSSARSKRRLRASARRG